MCDIACLRSQVGWIKPEQLSDAANKALGQAQGWYDMAFGASGTPSSTPKPEVAVKRSKLVLSNLYHKAPGLVVGGAVGSLIGYRIG